MGRVNEVGGLLAASVWPHHLVGAIRVVRGKVGFTSHTEIFNVRIQQKKSNGPRTENGRRGGLRVTALDSGASNPGSRPGRGHCVVFLGKTL